MTLKPWNWKKEDVEILSNAPSDIFEPCAIILKCFFISNAPHLNADKWCGGLVILGGKLIHPWHKEEVSTIYKIRII